MEDKNIKREVMIQLPWTLPSQPNVQTLVAYESNQTKVPLDLNISSTDTTAISSFAISMVIAVILGGLATWLAFWYGKKSFDLTKQSFDAVIAQINSSILEAKNIRDVTIKQIENNGLEANNNKNTIITQIEAAARTTIESNQNLAEMQFRIKISEIRAQRRLNLIENLRNQFGLFFGMLDHQVLKTLDISRKFYEENGSNVVPDDLGDDTWVAKELKELSDNRYLIKSSMESALLFLEIKDDLQMKINNISLITMDKFDEIGYLVRNNKEITKEKYAEYTDSLDELKTQLKIFLAAESERVIMGE
ncbi:MAG: hypothetical protein O2793_04915 [Proteobacteria bacterium]|nr:hypothetical protein [Pseudomonadota bacterium]